MFNFEGKSLNNKKENKQEEPQEGEEEKNEKESIGDKISKKVASFVEESKMPMKDYESTVGVYGGEVEEEYDEDQEKKRYYWNTEGLTSWMDRTGDRVLRTIDDNMIPNFKNMWEIVKKHPKLGAKFLLPESKRYRGSDEQVLENIEKLGLQEYYGPHKKGIEINESVLEGVALQDIYRGVTPEGEDYDVEKAVAQSSKYIAQMHKKAPIGELLTNDIVFTKRNKEDNEVDDPVLNIPDVVYNKNKENKEGNSTEWKTTDLLDFVINVGAEEANSHIEKGEEVDREKIENMMKNVLENYYSESQDEKIIKMLKSYIKRGRLTLKGDMEFEKELETKKEEEKNDNNGGSFNPEEESYRREPHKNSKFADVHNVARIGTNKKSIQATLKKSALQACEEVMEEQEIV